MIMILSLSILKRSGCPKMITAKLIKDLEMMGFELDFPSYSSNDERIIEILKENNERLNLAIPLLLKQKFDYKKIIKSINQEMIRQFNKIILITNRIFSIEGISNSQIIKIIDENNLQEDISEDEFNYYYRSFREYIRNIKEKEEEKIKEQIKIRSKLNVNKALSGIFSPGKRRIMDKIFKHEKLTNTELKYYYRSIKPLISAILNPELREYSHLIGEIRKYHF